MDKTLDNKSGASKLILMVAMVVLTILSAIVAICFRPDSRLSKDGKKILENAVSLLGDSYLIEQNMIADVDNLNGDGQDMVVHIQSILKTSNGYTHEMMIGRMTMNDVIVTMTEDAYENPDGIRFSQTSLGNSSSVSDWMFYVADEPARYDKYLKLEAVESRPKYEIIDDQDDSWYKISIPANALTGELGKYVEDPEKAKNSLECYAKVMVDTGRLEGLYATLPLKDTEEIGVSVKELSLELHFDDNDEVVYIPDEAITESGYLESEFYTGNE